MQDIRGSNHIAKKLNELFAAVGLKNMSETRHSATSGESSGVSEVGEVEMIPPVSPPKPGICNYSNSNLKNNSNKRKRFFWFGRAVSPKILLLLLSTWALLCTSGLIQLHQKPLYLTAAASTSSIDSNNLRVRTGRVGSV